MRVDPPDGAKERLVVACKVAADRDDEPLAELLPRREEPLVDTVDRDGHVRRVESRELDQFISLRSAQADHARGAPQRLDEQAPPCPSRAAKDRVQPEVVDEDRWAAACRSRERNDVCERREDDLDVAQLPRKRDLPEMPANTSRKERAAAIEGRLARFGDDSE